MLVWAVAVPEVPARAPDRGSRHQTVGRASVRAALPGLSTLVATQRSRDDRAGEPEYSALDTPARSTTRLVVDHGGGSGELLVRALISRRT